MELRAVLYRYAFDEHILAIRKSDDVVAFLLLCFWRFCYISLGILCIPRIEERAVRFLNTTYILLVGIPFHVAHLIALHGSPVFAIAVDDALASDSDVLAFRSTDAGVDTVARLGFGVNIEFLIGREDNKGVLVKMQLNIVLEGDRTSEPYTFRNHQSAASQLVQLTDALAEGFRVNCYTVSNAPNVLDIDFVGRYHGSAYLFYFNRQILIILRVVLCLHRDRQQKQGCHEV